MSGFLPYRPVRYAPAEMQRRADSFLQLMRTRRSVRAFSPEPVPEAVVETLLATAASAPSGANLQPWHFCVVGNAAIKRRLREAVEQEEQRNYASRFPAEWKAELAQFGTDHVKAFLEEAPLLIVCFKQAYREADGANRKNYYVTESVGIAIGLLIAAIHNAGLVTLPHTPNPMRFLNSLLGRPESEKPVVILPLGYPAAAVKVPRLERKPLDQVVSWYR